MKAKLLYCILLPLLCIAAASAQSPQPFLLQTGDSVVFYGDSITAQRYYTRDVEEFTLTRYPSLRIDFFNAGVSGDTVYGGYTGATAARLTRDVFPLKPTVITVMLGMNDPGYVPFDQHIFEVFQSGYKTLIDSISAALPQVKITLIASSPYDEVTHGTQFPGLSATVQRYGNFVEQLARDRHDAFANFNSALDDALHSAMKQNPDYAALLIPDRIHPSEISHWVMTEALMRAWHASAEVSFQKLDAGAGTLLIARNADISNVQRTSGGLSWTALEHSLPLPFSPDDPLTQFALKATTLPSQDQEILQVTGLPAKQFSLLIDGKRVADITAAQLAVGINLALLRTPMLDQARGLDWLEDRKMKLDAARFAIEGEMPPTPGTLNAIQTLRAAANALTEQQHNEGQPKPHEFALIATPAR
jgi:lysophospholipase L1-like esterase